MIDPKTGTITVSRHENMKPNYLLHVRAFDGKYFSTAFVQINVEKSENSGLFFQKNVYDGTVQENSTKVYTVAVLNILGSALNEHIIFSIMNPTDMFTIGKTSGVIRTTGIPFDRELTENYELIIEAKSKEPVQRVAHTVVNVTVLDVNDNCPIFVNLPYYATVSIDAQRGDLILKVRVFIV